LATDTASTDSSAPQGLGTSSIFQDTNKGFIPWDSNTVLGY
jgi:hypothetical protein